jgi:hypothetical protein
LVIKIFEGKNSIVTQSYIDEIPVGTIHLEKMIYGKKYEILIKGMEFSIMLFDDNHLIFIDRKCQKE